MTVPHVTSFCCCMGLEMGARFIGFVHLTLAIAGLVMSSIFATSAKEYKGTVEDAEDHLYSSVYSVSVSLCAISLIHLVLATGLLIAVFRRCTTGIRAWVWVMVSLYTSSLVYIGVAVLLYGVDSSGSDIFVSFLEGVLFYAYLAYCILTVNSYYMMLKSAADIEQPNKVDY